MQGKRLRALVLAAGLGTRLRPLTELVPKPLLPVAGIPLLGHTLVQLAAAGCEAVAVNLHHLGEQIRQRFGESFAGMPITWSDEPRLLGTLGALHPLRAFFAEADLAIVVNGDSLCRWPLRRMLRRHAGSGAAATLLLANRPDPEEFGGGVGIDKAGDVVSFRREATAHADVARRFVFAGAHVLDPALVANVGPEPADIVTDLYMPLLAAGGRIRSVVTGRPWHDMGTPQRFLDGVLDLARAGWPERLWRRSWISPEAAVAPGATLRRSAVEGGVKVGAGARVERSVLLPGARVGEGSVVREAIVGFGAHLPPGSWIERRMVSPRADGLALGPDDSSVGGVVYTPFERRPQ